MPIPQYHELFNPTLKALHSLGGSGTIREIAESVIDRMALSDNVVGKIHKKGPQTEIEYRLAWARTYLKHYGLVDNSQRAIWSLTPEGRQTQSVDPLDVIHRTRDILRNRAERKGGVSQTIDVKEDESLNDVAADKWREELLSLLQNMPPDAFERLCQRILRESGFIEVKVTGHPSDGGIDGHGILRLAGLVGIPVFFQCKRYKGSVGSPLVQAFRGALAGRADKGLFITTGTFTREANREATREGVSPIDLIDGELLIDKLKDLKLGVETRQIEEVQIKADFFSNI